ncbi:hypothetical protein Micbo1qcDRAFT_159785 [Microdochium bolleyi]|uniref:Uncharacterized protein n=1 Tax=Microdochium bolleyi TaxID=196109 RepID=A0A136JBM2_9PEZI|nr:hypothetical protein Micbo1qcDRAFT_159785 [Microdochium bolleyi]
MRASLPPTPETFVSDATNMLPVSPGRAATIGCFHHSRHNGTTTGPQLDTLPQFNGQLEPHSSWSPRSDTIGSMCLQSEVLVPETSTESEALALADRPEPDAAIVGRLSWTNAASISNTEHGTR